MRVGVIGTGFGARVVAPVFAATDGCEVVDTVSSRDTAAVAELCRRELDLVSVHSPPFLHAEHVRLALERGKHVLCDKPFGVKAGEAAAMLEQAEAAGVVHLVNFEFRCDPIRRRLRELVAGGAIGTVEHVQWTHVTSGSRVPLRRYGWLFDRDRGGGWLGAWGSHAIDALRGLVGEIRLASAQRRTTIAERPDRDGHLHACDAEDGFTARLEFESGATAVLDSTFAAAASLAPRVVIAGSGGVIEVVADARITVRAADGSREEVSRPAGERDPHLVPMQRWAERVRDAVRDGSPIAPSFADGLACRRVLDALLAG
ncbi:MAG: Gfo/Idh/MocA family protein [Acidimicrobiia bacterium]